MITHSEIRVRSCGAEVRAGRMRDWRSLPCASPRQRSIRQTRVSRDQSARSLTPVVVPTTEIATGGAARLLRMAFPRGGPSEIGSVGRMMFWDGVAALEARHGPERGRSVSLFMGMATCLSEGLRHEGMAI